MPWRCPACSTPIRRELTAAGHEDPQPNRVYRCGICRLELVLGDDGKRMIVAPLGTQDAPLKDGPKQGR
jgi:hypothetical protein